MNWRVHLSNRSIHGMQLLAGQPVLVAVWTDRNRVRFFDAANGAPLVDVLEVVTPPIFEPEGEAWRVFLAGLKAPNCAFLPLVETDNATVLTSTDGRLRVLWARHDHHLLVEVDGCWRSCQRVGDAPLVAVGLDREMGTVAALSADGLLHFYQQQVFVGSFPVAIDPDTVRPVVLVLEAGGAAVVVDRTSLQVVTMAGQVEIRQAVPWRIGPAACAPDGRWIVVADREQALLRVYDAGLQLVRQDAAHRLLRRAAQTQLLAAMPAPDAILHTLDVGQDGSLVLALGGTVCRTHIGELVAVPQPRTLL